MKKITVLLLTMLFSVFASAKTIKPDPTDGRVGNGGIGVVCRDADGRILSVEFYDRYEARVSYEPSIPFDLGDSSLSVEEKVNKAIMRLKRFDPVRAELHAKWAAEFLDPKSQKLVKGRLPLQPDAKQKVIPLEVGCNIEQIIIASAPKFKEDRRYRINSEIWNFMLTDKEDGANNIAQAALHEAAYREAFENYDQMDSVNSRYFVSKLCQPDDFDDAVLGNKSEILKYVNLLIDVGFSDFVYQDHKYKNLSSETLAKMNTKFGRNFEAAEGFNPYFDQGVVWKKSMCVPADSKNTEAKSFVLSSKEGSLYLSLPGKNAEKLYPNQNGILDREEYYKNLPYPYGEWASHESWRANLHVRPFWIRSESKASEPLHHYIVLLGEGIVNAPGETEYFQGEDFVSAWYVTTDLTGKTKDVRFPYHCKVVAEDKK